jgi:hypothetical protein
LEAFRIADRQRSLPVGEAGVNLVQIRRESAVDRCTRTARLLSPKRLLQKAEVDFGNTR